MLSFAIRAVLVSDMLVWHCCCVVRSRCVVARVLMAMRCVVMCVKLISINRWLDHGVRSWRSHTVNSIQISADCVMVVNINITIEATVIIIMMLTMRHWVSANNRADTVVCRIFPVRCIMISDNAISNLVF